MIAAIGVLLAVACAVEGCIADAPVLVHDGQLEQLEASFCDSLVTEGIVAEVTTGARCRQTHACAGGVVCSSMSADCFEDDALEVNELGVLECPFDPVAMQFVPPEEAADPWIDCQAALRDGHTGQACGATFTCGRVVSPCCAELASCGVQWPNWPSESEPEPSEHLLRLRACTSDCENVVPADSAVAIDCSSADPSESSIHGMLGHRCSGDFVCLDNADVREPGIAEGIDFRAFPRVWFCADGVVLGRNGSTQPPAIWPLL